MAHLDAGAYSIDNVSEEVNMDEMVKYLLSKNYVVVDKIEDNRGKIENIKFVARNDFYKYYYKSKSGNDFSYAKKGKGCRFEKENIDMYGYIYKYVPVVIEVYWSGDIINGYINGKGSGLYTSDTSFNEEFCYFEGEYVYGIPISDVDFYKVRIMDDNSYSLGKPLTIYKKETDYYLVENRDKLDQAMLDNFVSDKAKLECERYKNSVNDVRSVIANYKSYAEDIILNDKTPLLSQEIGGLSPVQFPLMPANKIILFEESADEYNKRHTLEAFKNFEGVDMKRLEEKDKESLYLVQKPLINDIDETLKYMTLLDGLSLTTPDSIWRAKQSYNASFISFYGKPNIERTNYYSVIESAQNIAKELKNASTGKLREKYADAEQKINDCRRAIIDERNRVYQQVVEMEKASKKREEMGKYEIDWDRSTAPSGELNYIGLLSYETSHENDGYIYTKSGGYYCVYNKIYNTNKEFFCYRIRYCSKDIKIKEKEYKSLDELVAAFVNAIYLSNN